MNELKMLFRRSNILKTAVIEGRKCYQTTTASNLKPTKGNKPKADSNRKAQAMKNLETLLNINRFESLHIANKYKSVAEADTQIIRRRYAMCKKFNITDETVMKYPDILAVKNLEEKVDLLKSLDYDLNITAALLRLDIRRLHQLIHQEKSCPDRMKNMAALLKLPLDVMCEQLSKKLFLISIDMEKIKSSLELLETNGLTIEDVQKDLWVLRYSNEYISQRITMARRDGIDKLKTWMIRCVPETQEVYIKRRSESKEILGDNSLTEYLSERLKCTELEARVLLDKQPAIKHKSVKKMKEILDFLFSQGFQPYQICRVPKILLHSVETTRQRLADLEQYGRQLDSLYVLTKSKKQFLHFLDTLAKSNKVKTDNYLRCLLL